ncbi:unnamed protein product [Prorocentrum cordatum]|uniref:Uncharacterized protein n=1 Tax=Prorocentrum cordatum TaxID=2364126 RepID=A0ABN9QN48_9DINO|nr:unnamed protein product [Polarella glacialis]
MLCPHVLFGNMYKDYPHAFRKYICPEPEALEHFWNDVRDPSHYKTHPVRLRPGHARICVPITIHGDGAPITGVGKAWGRLLDAWPWQSLVALGSTDATQHVIAMLREAVQSSSNAGRALTYVFRKLRWSLQALWGGVWPETDEEGKAMPSGSPQGELAGGRYACVRGLLGDLDYFFQVLNMPNYNSAGNPCGWCPCNASTMPWFDFRAGAEWVSRVYAVEEWRTSGAPHARPLLSAPGISIHSLMPDWMHIKHLGLDKRLYGSALHCLVHCTMSGTPDTNLITLRTEIWDVYKVSKTNSKFSRIKMTTFTIRLKGNLRGKAAEVKHLGPILLEAWTKYMNPQVSLHAKIRLLLRLSVDLDREIDSLDPKRMCMPEAIRQDLLRRCHGFLVLWSEVQDFFANDEEQPDFELFHITIKAHFLLHCCLLPWNPRRVWCYRGEDLMQRRRKLAFACSKRCKPWQVGTKAIRKYTTALQLAFQSLHAC